MPASLALAALRSTPARAQGLCRMTLALGSEQTSSSGAGRAGGLGVVTLPYVLKHSTSNAAAVLTHILL